MSGYLLLWKCRLRRWLRWEFWPSWALYPPVVLWILALGIRHRSFTLFTAVNPDMPCGGLVDIDKAHNLLALQRQRPKSVAQTLRIPTQQSLIRRISAAVQFMRERELDYPVVLKPVNGQRGVGVSIIRSIEDLEHYLTVHSHPQHQTDILLQEYLEGVEFGVFYMRYPSRADGFIFSVTRKQMICLLGDGIHSLKQLILLHPRASLMADFFFAEYANQLTRIPRSGQKIQLVELGSHCRGSLFIEGKDLITAELSATIDATAKAIGNYYFGRFDVRAPSEADLANGTQIKVMEANGVSSESANMYDPKYGLMNAYRVLFNQWRHAFSIAAENRARGVQPASFGELVRNIQSLRNR